MTDDLSCECNVMEALFLLKKYRVEYRIPTFVHGLWRLIWLDVKNQIYSRGPCRLSPQGLICDLIHVQTKELFRSMFEHMF